MSPQEIIFEDRAVGSTWIVCAVVVAIALGVGIFSASAGAPILFVVAVGVVALLVGLLGFFFFRIRNDVSYFYADRVERFRAGVPRDTMPYVDVQTVAWGIKADGSGQFLALTGPLPGDEPRIYLQLAGTSVASSHTLTEEKLVWLRDHLNAIVAARMIESAQRDGGTKWFDNVYITPEGLDIEGKVEPWSSARITTSDTTGLVIVAAAGARVKVSMIEDNVVPGLQAAEVLRQSARGRPPPIRRS